MFYGALLAVSVACIIGISFVYPLTLIALLALAILWKPYQAIRSGATGRDLIPALGATGIYELAYAVLLSIGLVLSDQLFG